jgi:hypothetical protein
MLSAKQNEKVLKLMERTINKIFKKKTANNLAEYMGGELTVNPPKNEKQYQANIKDPMEQIFSETKHILEKKLKLKINNKVYQPINNELYLRLALYGRYGNYYFNSSVPDTLGENANTYENSPLQQNTISGIESSDGSYSAFNGNTLASQMKVLLSDDPNIVGSSIGFFPLTLKSVGYRACRKLNNDYTGIVGGVLAVVLFNVDEKSIANLHN